VAGVLVAGLMTVALAGTASAKEITSGGGTGGTTTTCSPVSSLTTRGDARVGETGLASIDINWGVKPCDSKQAVTVDVTMYESANPAAVAYSNPAAPLSGRVTVFGIKIRTSYTVKVTVRDAATGALVGTGTAFAGATPKGV
jgi:hypothetical protein